MLQQLGRWLLFAGALLLLAGAGLYLLGRLGLGKLPGDISFGGKSWRVYLPLGTSILLSVLLTLLLLVVQWLRR